MAGETDPTKEPFEQNLELLGKYIMDGEPLEKETLLSLMKQPATVEAELTEDGSLARALMGRILLDPENVDQMRQRYDRVRTLATIAIERSGDEDFRGWTSSGTGVAGSALRNSDAAQRGHRRRTYSPFKQAGQQG